MGTLRFMLAAFVVLFHLGGWSMLVGRLSVMGFYVVSGYLITRALDTGYFGLKGKMIFAVNRFLRLYPLFIFFSLVSYLCFRYLGKVPIDASNPVDLWLPVSPDLGSLNLLPSFRYSEPGALLLVTESGIVDQSWSIGVELSFYMMAICSALINLRRTLLLCFLLSFLYFTACFFLYMPDFKNGYDKGIYKDALTTSWMFCLGGLVYFFNKERMQMLDLSRWLYTLALLTMMMLGFFSNTFLDHRLEVSAGPWRIVLWVIIVVTVLCVALVLTNIPKKEPDWSRKLGDLSYGMYLNHFLIAWGFMYVGSFAGLSLFGRMNTPGFGLLGLFFSALFAWITLNTIEEPVEILRRRIKKIVAGIPGS
jgi:peptidoglycan/LPS O-acetylase OafA/YrhL